MYYKITDQQSWSYQELVKMLKEEKEIETYNLKAIEEKVKLPFTQQLAHWGQQNFRRVTQYIGFEFTEPEKVDQKIWKRSKEHPEIFIPNRRTKLGREMLEFLNNGLKSSIYSRPLHILKVNNSHIRRFTFPFVAMTEDQTIILFLDDQLDPKGEEVIEITEKEFTELHSKAVIV